MRTIYENYSTLCVRTICSVSSRSFCKRGHNGLFKILGGRHVVWACEAQIPRGAHRIQEGANVPHPLNETLTYIRGPTRNDSDAILRASE